MKRLTLWQTRNGCLIVDGEFSHLSPIDSVVGKSWSYATPQEAADRVVLELQAWEKEEAPSQTIEGD